MIGNWEAYESAVSLALCRGNALDIQHAFTGVIAGHADALFDMIDRHADQRKAPGLAGITP